MNSNHFGFRSVKPDSVTQWIDDSNMVDLVLFDFSIAFDTGNHQNLFTKLYSTGIDGAVLSWIKVFLSNRTVEVVVSG